MVMLTGVLSVEMCVLDVMSTDDGLSVDAAARVVMLSVFSFDSVGTSLPCVVLKFVVRVGLFVWVVTEKSTLVCVFSKGEGVEY